ncbi:MAG: PEP-CTERM sorting domain-containing protein [Verrucomicrobiaceae bacterium]|nr:MAG: PEP-CTERM sorting domain-containing protein [Verrucomicrobiaceae bacterium]
MNARHPYNRPQKPLLYACLLAGGIISSQASTVLNFPDFSDTSALSINGNAAQVGNVLRVTPSLPNQSGSVFSTTPVTLDTNVSFSTFFSYRISNSGGISDEDGQGADGLVFVVQTNSNSVGGIGGGIGYSGIPNSLGIEFDSWNNGLGLGDPDGNHVAIDTGGSLAPNLGAAPVTGARLNNGDIWYAWVDYDGTTDSLEVRLGDTSTRPLSALLSATVDLTGVLGSTNTFVGFTSGTGAAYNDHDLLSWEFRDDYNPVINPPTESVPEGGGTLSILMLGLSGLMIGKKFNSRRTAAGKQPMKGEAFAP